MISKRIPSFVLICLALFLALAAYQFIAPTSAWENQLAQWLRFNLNISTQLWIYQVANILSWTIYPAVAACAIWQVMIKRKHEARPNHISYLAVISIFLIDLLKIVFNRDRPEVIGDLPSILASSFPSTHTYAATIIVLLLLPHATTNQTKIILWLYPALMAWSRVIVYAHHPTDTLASIALAIALYGIIGGFNQKQTKNFDG